MALAGWLLGRPPGGSRSRKEPHGKMRDEEDR
jgi:hypothetical protein